MAARKRKIAILTHPVDSNYGGILQAYALQETLKGLGCDPMVVNLPAFPPGWQGHASRIKRFITWCLHLAPMEPLPPLRHLPYLPLFVLRRLKRTRKCRLSGLAELQDMYGFDAWVVGSDQVWNAEYAKYFAFQEGKGVACYFLESLPQEVRRGAISYAASFGHGVWRMNEAETEACAGLLRDFKAVSVREESGVDMCREYLRRGDVEWLPDPTLLLPKERYLALGGKAPAPACSYIATYMLDWKPGMEAQVEALAAELGMPVKHLMPFSATTRREWIYGKVEDWLATIANAAYVVTDSFHGCAFSVIFNRPFVTTSNKRRGSARFDSLVKMCHLGERVAASCTAADLKAVLDTPVDWETVNAARAQAAERGVDFLRCHLLP